MPRQFTTDEVRLLEMHKCVSCPREGPEKPKGVRESGVRPFPNNREDPWNGEQLPEHPQKNNALTGA